MKDRRGFLQPERIARAVEKFQDAADASIGGLQRAVARPAVTAGREAMACLFEIQFGAGVASRQPVMDAFDRIDQTERRLTVYSDASEVSRVNAAADARENALEVSDELFDLLARCAAFSRESGGAFDVTAGPLIAGWGFQRRQGKMPPDADVADWLRLVGMEHVTLDEAAQTVRLTRPGMRLNLGAVGKGYALDRAAALLADRSFGAALLSAGHSSMVAVGRPPWDSRWRVDLAHPLQRRRLATLHLHDRALSTSGVGEQFFLHQGRRYSHLLDPRTGRPVQGMLQATALAPTAERAEMLSTAFFVLGPAWTAGYCRRHPEVGALLVTDEGVGRLPRVRQLGSLDATPAGG